jgi:hypothetical protein
MERMQRIENGRTSQLARGLGWFSVGLGLTELFAPRPLARAIGIDDDDGTRNALVACGVRELAAGAGILARPQQPAFLWNRVVGDAIDLALLGYAFGKKREGTGRLIGAIGAVLGVAALDVLGGILTRRARQERLVRSILIDAESSEVEQAWGANRARLFSSGRLPVSFEAAPGGRGTLVRAEVKGGVPRHLVTKALRELKQIVETGEIVRSDASIHRLPHAAQPSEVRP